MVISVNLSAHSSHLNAPKNERTDVDTVVRSIPLQRQQ